MSTTLSRPVTRRSDESKVRDCGQLRRLVITLYPDGMIGLRPERTRREEIIPLDAVYDLAVKARVRAEKAIKAARKGVRA